jgi:hypothetical protein
MPLLSRWSDVMRVTQAQDHFFERKGYAVFVSRTCGRYWFLSVVQDAGGEGGQAEPDSAS